MPSLLKQKKPKQVGKNARQAPHDLSQGASKYLIQTESTLKNCVVIFADLSGFQDLTLAFGDKRTFSIMTHLFSLFDAAAARYGVRTIKTNGDQHISICHQNVINNADTSHLSNTQRVFLYALAIHHITQRHPLLRSLGFGLRIGVARGDVLVSHPSYTADYSDIWGNTVNQAAMLERYTTPFSTAFNENAQHALTTPYKDKLVPQVFKTKVGALNVYCHYPTVAPSNKRQRLSSFAVKNLTLPTGKHHPYH